MIGWFKFTNLEKPALAIEFDGNICVGAQYNFPAVCFSALPPDKKTAIGNEVTDHIMEPEVMLIFRKPESIDVVTGFLTKVKERMLNGEYERGGEDES